MYVDTIPDLLFLFIFKHIYVIVFYTYFAFLISHNTCLILFIFLPLPYKKLFILMDFPLLSQNGTFTIDCVDSFPSYSGDRLVEVFYTYDCAQYHLIFFSAWLIFSLLKVIQHGQYSLTRAKRYPIQVFTTTAVAGQGTWLHVPTKTVLVDVLLRLWK